MAMAAEGESAAMLTSTWMEPDKRRRLVLATVVIFWIKTRSGVMEAALAMAALKSCCLA